MQILHLLLSLHVYGEGQARHRRASVGSGGGASLES